MLLIKKLTNNAFGNFSLFQPIKKIKNPSSTIVNNSVISAERKFI